MTPLPIRVIGGVPLARWRRWPATWLVSDSRPPRSPSAAWCSGDRGARDGLRRWAGPTSSGDRSGSTGTALVGLFVLVTLPAPRCWPRPLGWARVREVLLGDRDGLTVLLAVAIWVAIWLGALVLAGVASAVRVAAWTLIADRPT